MHTAGSTEHWITECSACRAMFRDGPEQAGVCPHCGNDNGRTT